MTNDKQDLIIQQHLTNQCGYLSLDGRYCTCAEAFEAAADEQTLEEASA